MVHVFGEAVRPYKDALYKAAKDHIAAANTASAAGKDIDAARQKHLDCLDPKDFQTAPADPSAQQQIKDAVKQGKGAWKGYQAASTAGVAQQIDGIVPTDFR